jgi:hypothetical protein
MNDPIKTKLQGEIDVEVKQFTCKVNGEPVFGATCCKECDGYQMCVADGESEIFQFRIH